MMILKKILKIIFDIVIYFLIAVISLYLCLVIYQKVFMKSELLSINNYYIFQIASSSMETDLHVGDYILVLKTDDYKVGDIITYEENGVYITHRIHDIDGDNIIAKGDANDSLDDSISKSKVLGKVLFKLYVLTFVFKFKYIIIAIILSSFILETVFKNKNEDKLESKTDIEVKETV